MKKSFLFLLLFNAFFSAQAQDPFDHTQRTTQTKVINQANSVHCPSHQKVLAENSSFQQLKLVGIIQLPEHLNAIFSHQHQQIIFVKNQDVIAQERLQITEISPQQITLFDCAQSQIVYLTF
ncbi:pilus assembly protein PilP [Avibacterium sp. 20-129]|uniref:pilus assembly protein PilP n=1 Tax=Avibacterium sp. 20-129 TaxID=2911525 RepID=UPI002245A370|nr:pilus assembly protein PilP [Avibacterium sp. 20-129]MCW9698750.1 pilus assembly protein PilP [Avibacterium sp. 20-129]